MMVASDPALRDTLPTWHNIAYLC